MRSIAARRAQPWEALAAGTGERAVRMEATTATFHHKLESKPKTQDTFIQGTSCFISTELGGPLSESRQWHTLRRPKQKDRELEGNLGYTARPCSQNK